MPLNLLNAAVSALPDSAGDLDVCAKAVRRVLGGLKSIEDLLQKILKDIVRHMSHKMADGCGGTLTQGRTSVAQKSKESIGGLLLKTDGGENVSKSEKNLAKDIK